MSSDSVLALFLAVAKWPFAIVMVLLTPGAARGVWPLLLEVWESPRPPLLRCFYLLAELTNLGGVSPSRFGP